MYKSEACWKKSTRAVNAECKILWSDVAKYDALKENIKINIIGLSWTQFKHALSCQEENIL